MFRHEGAERSHRQNLVIAGWLASIAGFVNSAGFVLIGVFTSHITGNVGRLAEDAAVGDPQLLLWVALVACYFAGAFLASVALESNVAGRRGVIYAGLLLAEALLLGGFAIDAALTAAKWSAAILCVAMGLQNSLVTRLSGAVVRTTHLTGVVTDLGIECARWFRAWRGWIGERTGIRLVAGDAEVVTPSKHRTVLLAAILIAFVVGSIAGAAIALRLGPVSIVLPAVAAFGASAYAAHGARLDTRDA